MLLIVCFNNLVDISSWPKLTLFVTLNNNFCRKIYRSAYLSDIAFICLNNFIVIIHFHRSFDLIKYIVIYFK